MAGRRPAVPGEGSSPAAVAGSPQAAVADSPQAAVADSPAVAGSQLPRGLGAGSQLQQGLLAVGAGSPVVVVGSPAAVAGSQLPRVAGADSRAAAREDSPVQVLQPKDPPSLIDLSYKQPTVTESVQMAMT